MDSIIAAIHDSLENEKDLDLETPVHGWSISISPYYDEPQISVPRSVMGVKIVCDCDGPYPGMMVEIPVDYVNDVHTAARFITGVLDQPE